MVSRNPSNDLDHILHPKFSKIPENLHSPENTLFLCMDSQAMRAPGSDLRPSRGPEATRLPVPTVWVVPFHAKQLDSPGHWPSRYLDGNIILLSVLRLGSWFTACPLPPWWGKAPHPREVGGGYTPHSGLARWFVGGVFSRSREGRQPHSPQEGCTWDRRKQWELQEAGVPVAKG